MENRHLVCNNAYKNTAYQLQILTHPGEIHFLNFELDLADSGDEYYNNIEF
jgi:hypothetical protein